MKLDPEKAKVAGKKWRESARGIAWYEANRERLIAKSKKNAAQINERRRGGKNALYSKQHKEKFPEKRRARTSVLNALASGTLTKLPCLICGELNTHAHHPSYSLPLVVTWLCSTHHYQLHTEFRRDK